MRLSSIGSDFSVFWSVLRTRGTRRRKEKKEKTINSQSSKHSIVLDSLLLNRRQAMRHGKGGEREERRERKERGGEEGEKKGLENPLGVTGVL